MNSCHFRRSTNVSGMKDGGGLLEPLLSVSSPSDKSEFSKSTESVQTVIVQRDASKLGLFSLVGLSIVLFQVNIHNRRNEINHNYYLLILIAIQQNSQ